MDIPKGKTWRNIPSESHSLVPLCSCSSALRSFLPARAKGNNAKRRKNLNFRVAHCKAPSNLVPIADRQTPKHRPGRSGEAAKLSCEHRDTKDLNSPKSKKLLVTSASLLVTSAVLVGLRIYFRIFFVFFCDFFCFSCFVAGAVLCGPCKAHFVAGAGLCGPL